MGVEEFQKFNANIDLIHLRMDHRNIIFFRGVVYSPQCGWVLI